MTKLTKSQAGLLVSASGRHDGRLLPPVGNADKISGRMRITVETLIKRGLATEERTGDAAAAYRSDGGQLYEVTITAAGRAAVGIDKPVNSEPDTPPPVPLPGVEPRLTKIGTVLAMLRRPDGASLNELVDATSWLPHTMRAVLSGLRKKGNNITKRATEQGTRYAVVQGW